MSMKNLVVFLAMTSIACSHVRRVNKGVGEGANAIAAKVSDKETQVRFGIELEKEGKKVAVPRVQFSSEESAVLIGPIVNNRIRIQIENRLDNAARFLWDESSIVDENGVSHKIFRHGTKYAEKTESILPSVIPPQSKIDEVIMIGDWIKGYKYDQYFFNLNPVQLTVPELTTKSKAAIGRSIKVFITLESEGEKSSEIYELKIGDTVIVTRPKGDMGPL